MKNLTKKEIEVLAYHIRTNISWKEGGSFTRENKEGDFVFDKKEAKIALRAIEKLEKKIIK